MVSFHVWTFVWIIVLLFLFSPIVDGNNKHRATHRHRHHRHHHRKHPKHHPPSIKNSLEKHARRTNLTKILSTLHWSPTETSTSLLFPKSSYSDNETVTSSANLSTVQKTANINLYNSTRMPSGIHDNSSHSKATSGFVKNNNISSTSMKNIVENSPNIPTGMIDDSVDPNYLPHLPIPEETSKITVGGSRSAGTSSRDDHRRYSQDLRGLFGSSEERTNLPKILIDAPVVQLVRRKRSIPSEELEAADERSREPSLLDFNGPSIENDPEEVLNRESSESLHKRVKRDGPEPEVIPSALSFPDASYFRDLEDSFALSALEVEAREARSSGSQRRIARQSQSGVDSFLSLSRPKREAEDDKNQSYSAEDHSAEFKKMPPADYIMENDSTDSTKKIGENEDQRNASSRNLLAGETDRENGIVDVFTSTDISAESVDHLSSIRLDLQRSKNTTHSLDSSTSPLPTAPEAEDNKRETIHVDSSPQSSGPENYTLKVDEPITGYRVEDVENEEKTSSASLGSREMNDREVEEKNRQPAVESVSVDSSLRDENSFSRYGLDDVYPEIVEDPANPSSMVRLVRTKRFGDGVSNPEAPDASYASEVDNSRVAEEPYAEDNRIIDSMLSKVDYRSGYAQPSRSARKENEARLDEEDIYSPTGEGTPVRKKRGVSSRRARKKGGGRRGGSKKRKKSHEGRAKKHHRAKLKRSKIKRESDDLSEGKNLEWEEKFEPADDSFDGRRLDAIEKDFISPHDGRRRRVSEDEDEENFYPDTNEAAGRYRRDLRDSGNVDKNSEGHRDEEVRSTSVFAEGRSKLNEKSKNREKRDGLQELKYFQNIRETDGGQNRSEETADKRLLSVDAVKPIRDIEQIVEELLAKVNELRGYVSEVGTVGAAEDSQASGTASSAVDRTTAERSKAVDGVTTSLDGSSSRPAAASVEQGQPEACRKYPASRTRQLSPARSNGRSARNLRAQRCSKKARRKRTSHRKWDRWTDWSSCSVTCGRGRQIRWRHCIRNCSTAETEMEEKACQLPACAPGKFLGIFG